MTLLVYSVISLPQDLRCALQKTRAELQSKEATLKESDAEKYTVVQEKDRSITRLKRSLQDKEQQLQVRCGVLRPFYTFSACMLYIHLHNFAHVSDPV